MKSPEPTEINGHMYYQVKQFAMLTNRTTQSIYKLVKSGNAIRKLKAVYIGEKPYIPVEEVTDFPFISPGPFSEDNVYHYTLTGETTK